MEDFLASAQTGSDSPNHDATGTPCSGSLTEPGIYATILGANETKPNPSKSTAKTMSNAITVQPYLSFDGRCEEALEFYRRTLGAQVQFQMRYNESPEPPPPGCAPPDGNKIMHATFQIGGTTLMASDGRGTGNPKFEGFSLSYTVTTEAEAERAFNALAEGGQVEMPLGKTFFSPRFGLVADRFGVRWMVYVPQAH